MDFSGLVSVLGCSFLSLSQRIITEQPTRMTGGCGVFIVGNPKDEMTVLTRGDNLTRVHNGRFSHQCATLLEEQVKLTHCLSFASETESTKPLSPELNSAHMRFLL